MFTRHHLADTLSSTYLLYSHVWFIWSSIIQLFRDLRILYGNHLNTMYNKVSH